MDGRMEGGRDSEGARESERASKRV
jgi:hypothetical protein